MNISEFTKIYYEAQKEAIKEGIRANTILINKRFAKSNAFAIKDNNCNGAMYLPQMLFGLEVKGDDGILPDDVVFALLGTKTEREKLIEQTRAEVEKEYEEDLKEIFNEFYDQMKGIMLEFERIKKMWGENK